MLIVYTLALVLFGLAIGGMAIGSILGRRALQRGTCGGSMDFESGPGCDACRHPCDRRRHKEVHP